MSMVELHQVVALVNRDGVLVEMTSLVVSPTKAQVLPTFIQHNQLQANMIIKSHINFKHYVITGD